MTSSQGLKDLGSIFELRPTCGLPVVLSTVRPAGRRRFIGAAGAPADQLHKLLCHVNKGRCLAIAGGGARSSLADSDALVQFAVLAGPRF